MSFRVISLFRCAVEVIMGHDSLMRVEHHSSDLFCRRRSAGNSVGKVGAVPEGEGIIGKHCGASTNPTDDDTHGPTSSLFYTFDCMHCRYHSDMRLAWSNVCGNDVPVRKYIYLHSIFYPPAKEAPRIMPLLITEACDKDDPNIPSNLKLTLEFFSSFIKWK